MDRNLAIAIGIALAGHAAVLAAARHLPTAEPIATSRPQLQASVLLPTRAEDSPRLSDAIDIEFLAPVPVTPTEVVPADRPEPQSDIAPPTLPSASTATSFTSPRSATAEAPFAATAETGARAETPMNHSGSSAILSMRGASSGQIPVPTTESPGAGNRPGAPTGGAIPNLDPRVALAGSGEMPARSAGRPDLLGPTATSSVRSRGSTETWIPTGGGTMRARKQPFHAKIKRDGTIEFRDKPNVQIEGVRLSKTLGMPVLFGRFDVTDAVMKQLGETLYPYRKRKLMDESRDMRAAMAAEAHREQLQEAIGRYRKHLRGVWNHPDLSLPERRRALFLLWDECAESGTDEVLASAASIRAMTISFIQRNLPQGGDLEYTAAELQAYNKRRRSHARFAPYQGP